MTATLLAETRISLGDLADREGVHRATVDRWCDRGIDGHRLESIRIGFKRFTTDEAYRRWLEKINAAEVTVG